MESSAEAQRNLALCLCDDCCNSTLQESRPFQKAQCLNGRDSRRRNQKRREKREKRACAAAIERLAQEIFKNCQSISSSQCNSCNFPTTLESVKPESQKGSVLSEQANSGVLLPLMGAGSVTGEKHLLLGSCFLDKQSCSYVTILSLTFELCLFSSQSFSVGSRCCHSSLRVI